MAQYIEGYTVFDDPSEAMPPLSGWSLGMVIIGSILAVVVLISMGWFLWHKELLPSWPVKGKRKKKGYQVEGESGLGPSYGNEGGKMVSNRQPGPVSFTGVAKNHHCCLGSLGGPLELAAPKTVWMPCMTALSQISDMTPPSLSTWCVAFIFRYHAFSDMIALNITSSCT